MGGDAPASDTDMDERLAVFNPLDRKILTVLTKKFAGVIGLQVTIVSCGISCAGSRCCKKKCLDARRFGL